MNDSDLTFFLRPRSVMVVGASTRPETLGGKIFSNLLQSGFGGDIYPVNPKSPEVQGVTAYPSIEKVPGPVDLAVLVVPRDAVLPALEACGELPVKAVAVISAGFSETGEEGAALEQSLVETADRCGLRLLGPNCMGVFNTDPAVSVDATFNPVSVIPGGVGLVSQSGALGCAILGLAAGIDLGFSSFVSIGNAVDVGVEDALRFWETDPLTRVVTCYLESIGNVASFADAARRLSDEKPVIAVKAARSDDGLRAASSHTGALATDERAIEALFRQSGVLRAASIQEMCDWAAAFEACPLPKGRGVAIITNAGGPAILAVDACSDVGLDLPVLSRMIQEELRGLLPPEAAVGNPVDMIASATALDYRRTMEIVAEDPGVDMILVLNVTPPIGSGSLEVLKAISSTGVARSMPVVSAFLAVDTFYPQVTTVAGAPPVYRFPEPAVGALSALVRYSEVRAFTDGSFADLEVQKEKTAALLDRFSSEGGQGEGGLMPHDPASEILAAYGIPLPVGETVTGPEEAAAAADRIGGPVALKASVPGLMHKAEVGGVVTGLRPAEVAPAARAMEESVTAAGHILDGFVVQEMITGGIELIASAGRDPILGTQLMVGLGGYFTEALDDVQLGLLPIGPAGVERMLRSLRGWPVLEGSARGAGADLPALVELLGRLALLAEHHPRIVEIEINPVICLPEPNGCRVVDIVMRTGSSVDGDNDGR